jgi:hypothetical protein
MDVGVAPGTDDAPQAAKSGTIAVAGSMLGRSVFNRVDQKGSQWVVGDAAGTGN